MFAVLLAFLPAAVIGVAAHKIIKDYLFESPLIICTALVHRRHRAVVRRSHAAASRAITTSWISRRSTALGIGFCQCLAMIPGVSRSGSSIVGAMFLGTDKRTGAEFSFFLAMPTMAGAFAYDLYKNWALLTPDDVHHHRAGLHRGLRDRRRSSCAMRSTSFPAVVFRSSDGGDCWSAASVSAR